MTDDAQKTQQAKRDVAAMDFKMYSDEAAKRLEYEVKFAEMVFKALVLVNGGAMVALFSLVGAIGSKNITALTISPVHLWAAFCAFSIGLVATLAAGICAYFTQRYFSETVSNYMWTAQADMAGAPHNERWKTSSDKAFRAGNIWLRAAVGAVLVAALAFVAGSASALWAVLPK